MGIMAKKSYNYSASEVEPDAGFPSFFDLDGAEEPDLWFQPDGDPQGGDEAPPRALLFPRPTGLFDPVLFDPVDWARAQADLSGELAALCYLFGMLEARLAPMGAGFLQRLALREAAELSWWASTHTGETRVSEEGLTLWLALRVGPPQTGPQTDVLHDSLALQEAAWAARRLMAPPDLIRSGPLGAAELLRFLGDGGVHKEGALKDGWMHVDGHEGDAVRGHRPGDKRQNAKFAAASDAVQDLAELMSAAQYLHPVTQSALLFHAWRSFGPGAAVQVEAAAMAACLGGQMALNTGTIHKNRAIFMPLTLGGGAGLRGSGTAVNRLSQWIQGASQATLWALRYLERLQDWHMRTQTILKGLSGRTPNLLATLLAGWPIVTAPMAEAQTGASRATVQRNLDLMHQKGLIREITGQGRYRVWTAKI